MPTVCQHGYSIICLLSLTLSIPSLFDQGNGNVAKETKVKSLGVEGVNDSKDGGVKDSYVSADKYSTVNCLSLILDIHSFNYPFARHIVQTTTIYILQAGLLAQPRLHFPVSGISISWSLFFVPARIPQDSSGFFFFPEEFFYRNLLLAGLRNPELLRNLRNTPEFLFPPNKTNVI